ncbi:MAG: glycerol-3-phosphate acyltransferase [Firmicutes bacterium]|nr:glycerol-3-phosphate acyltransferase [Bacillota bacterium]
MPEFLIIALVVIGSYLLGNINFALIIAKFKKIDLKKKGSGNLGTMNVSRNLGTKFGFLVLILDVIKGAVPCILGWFLIGGLGFGEIDVVGVRFVSSGRIGAYIASLAVILGHIYPVFLKFKGGKGIASTLGIMLVLQPFGTLITFALSFVFLVITKMGAVTSFIVTTVPVILENISLPSFSESPYAIASAILIFILFSLTIIAHRSNIVKLFSGTENKTRVFKTKEEKELKRLGKLKELEEQKN